MNAISQPAAGRVRSNAFSLIGLLVSAAIPLAAAPSITSIQNAASNITPGLPGAPLAQGSIFIIKGSGLGPATISIASSPFQSTTLSGTSISITFAATPSSPNGAIVDALMYYTSDSQVAALLPSNTPTGSGVFKVTYNGQTSDGVGHTVGVSSPGVFTVDSTGRGPAIVTYADYSLVSSFKAANCGGPNTTCGAANPGDTLILWATGLGPVNGDDASGAGLGVNMPNLPLKLWLGGVQAPVIYQGRSGCCVGEDQIVFTVPQSVPTGCAVPLAVQIGGNISNTTPMPVAVGSRSCNLLDPAIAQVDASQIAGTLALGVPELDHVINSGSFQDVFQPTFLSFTVPPAFQPFAGALISNMPIGTCTASQIGLKGIENEVITNLAPVDAGSSFTISGPNGSMMVSGNPGDQVLLSAGGTFLTPGNYTITGTGGKDIGPFSATVTIPALPKLTSPASANGFTVSRNTPLTITWVPNNSPGHVEVQIGSFAAMNLGVQITCTAPISAGTLTIPSFVLLSLPTGNGTFFNFQPGDGPGGPANESAFSAKGLALGIAQTFVDGITFNGFPITN